MSNATRSHLVRDLTTRRTVLVALMGLAGLQLSGAAATRSRRRSKKQGEKRGRLSAAASPARERELACSDGTTFTGEQVRQGAGRPPHTWRNVNPGTFPVAFNFHAATVTAPDGAVVESVTWDNAQGVDNNKELVTCSFTIPIGPFAGFTADFVGFFIP